VPASAWWWGAAPIVLALSGCGGPVRGVDPGAPAAAVPDAAPGPAGSDWSVPFTVRGRLPGPRLRWRIDERPAPVPASALREALLGASRAWSRDGVADVAAAADDEPADLTVVWYRADEDPCRRFGRDSSVAHSGPLGERMFMHLNASVAWSGGYGSPGESLDVAVAHELGHALGLDHSPDPSSLMDPDTHLEAPAPPDLAGLHTLYGGGSDAPGDVIIERAGSGGRTGHALRDVAPSDRTELALFDCDGDGDDELLIWRTDPAGIGALTIYDFARHASDDAGGPLLARTLGPMLDLVPLEGTTSLRRSDDGRRWLLNEQGEVVRVYAFEAQCGLRVPDALEQVALDLPALLARDAPPVLGRSGSGAPAVVSGPRDGSPCDTPGGPSGAPGVAPGMDGPRVEALEGDLDGDGRAERLRRL